MLSCGCRAIATLPPAERPSTSNDNCVRHARLISSILDCVTERKRSPRSRLSRTHLGRRLHALRAARGWSLDVMAKASGVSRSMLSQIERDRANPTLMVASRIALALGVTLDELAQSPSATSSVSVIRGDDRSHHYHSDKLSRIRTLSPLHLEKDVEFYELRLSKGGALRSAAHFEGTREYLTVTSGQVEIRSAGDSEMLSAGDSASYRADVPHAIVNTSRTEVVAHLVVIYL